MQSLAVKYRPTKFSDVCSQTSIIKILNKQLELKQYNNCYLFCGSSGCGKTTIARIFANEINNYQGTPIEIDGASNNGVDNVRDIILAASERSLNSKYKIYIIDECHALTSNAWQAFLKCIEEPPEFTIFIFCTTDPQKLPNTILNRMMRFNFTKIKSDVIKSRLEYICQCENFINYKDACDYISKIAHGCMRDAISTLDKASSYNHDLSINNVFEAIGGFSYNSMFELVNYMIDGNESEVLKFVDELDNSGKDLQLFINQYFSFCLDIMKYAIFKDVSMTSIPNVLENELKRATNFDTVNSYYSYLINKILDCKNSIKNDTNIKSTIEVIFLNICRCI